MLRGIAGVELLLCWVVWWYPFVFRAPHRQKRASITALLPTRIGLLLETIGIGVAFNFRVPGAAVSSPARMAGGPVLGVIGIVLAWTAVAHLGRQFRIHAGLYVDHELVRTGPYAVVRHPIYASLLAMLLCTILLLTRWPWPVAALVLYVAGTEIRVRTEDGLLASRFGEEFEAYRRKVPAYIPLVR
ncbi:MAG: isoprenylcysteine carboxylmethyltransferase family protein [Acidobacteriia bacterium]|nr:isoprenylcysteine carboxylmethyltransferase family protein [Terriglobia bacterium]